jgi:hypothetical protein
MDEISHQTWADAREITRLLSSEYQGSIIPCPVSRIGKRATPIACIAVDGSFLWPGIVICRKIFDDEHLLHGFTSGKVETYHGNKGYIGLQIFNDWITDTFVQNLIARRQKWSSGGSAFLVLDHCPAHHGQL